MIDKHDLLIHYYCPPGKKNYLGSKDNRKCRFCGKSEGEITFKKIAHAISEGIGNKSLLSYYECDDCNGHFSTLEDSFIKFIDPYRTLFGIKGKKGHVVKVKQKGFDKDKNLEYNKLKIENINGNIRVNITTPDISINDDKVNKSVSLSMKTDKYNPVAVLKCLIKMGISIMPEEELQYFTETIKWTIEKDHSKWLLKSPLKIYLLRYNLPIGIEVIKYPYVCLYKRVEDILSVPYMMFQVHFACLGVQVVVPSICKDSDLGHSSSFTTPLYVEPRLFDYFSGVEVFCINSCEKCSHAPNISYGYRDLTRESLNPNENDKNI
ncbi:MAG: hypothetical protein AB1782_13745 [Cyanobacteriota bacterium]